MMDWTGFSDEDLRRLKKSVTSSGVGTPADENKPRQANLNRNSRTRKPARPTRDGTHASGDEVAAQLPSNQRLMQPKVPKQPSEVQPPAFEKVKEPSDAGKSGRSPAGTVASGTVETEKAVDAGGVTDTKMADKHDEEVDIELDEQTIITKEMVDLEKFRSQQKMMEELNKRKKKMLTDALQQRQKQAKAEATKLTHIKRELDHLDQLVNTDVSVIRDKIEAASREYLEAQKRYDRAEKEFIESKTDLHQKAEAKDLLTEHLYTVIHQNEMRKAKKLAELMHKLEMEMAENEEENIEISSPAPVPLCLIMPLDRLGVQRGPTSPSSPPETSVESSRTESQPTSDVTQEPCGNSGNDDCSANVAVNNEPNSEQTENTASSAESPLVETGTTAS